MTDVHEKILGLERRLRRTQMVATTAMAGLLVLVTVAAAQRPAENLDVGDLTAKSISSGSFTLRDDKDRPRVAIRMGEDGGPFVSLLDENTRSRLLLSIHENQQPLIQFANTEEQPQMNLFYNKNLGTAIIMYGSDGRAIIAVPNDQAPLAEFYNANGDKTFAAP